MKMNLELVYEYILSKKDQVKLIEHEDLLKEIIKEFYHFLSKSSFGENIIRSRTSAYMHNAPIALPEIEKVCAQMRKLIAEVHEMSVTDSAISKDLSRITFGHWFPFETSLIYTDLIPNYSTIKSAYSSENALLIKEHIQASLQNRFESAYYVLYLLVPFYEFSRRVMKQLYDVASHHYQTKKSNLSSIVLISDVLFDFLDTETATIHKVQDKYHTNEWLDFVLLAERNIKGKDIDLQPAFAASIASLSTLKKMFLRVLDDCLEEVLLTLLNHSNLTVNADGEPSGNADKEMNTNTLEGEAKAFQRKSLKNNEQAYSTTFGTKKVHFVVTIKNIGKPSNKNGNEQESAYVSKCAISDKLVFNSKDEVKNNHLRLLCALLLDSLPGQSNEYLDQKRIKELVKDLTSATQIRNHAKVLCEFLKTDFKVESAIIEKYEMLRGKWKRTFPQAKNCQEWQR